jgi:uncharacterized RDD family membrane protein YckC
MGSLARGLSLFVLNRERGPDGKRRIAILTCEKCGTEIQQGASSCLQCGIPVSVAQIGPVYVPQTAPRPETIPAIPQSAATQARPVYAGFWLRAAAFLIDNLIFGFMFAVVVAIYSPALLTSPDPNALKFKVISLFTRLGLLVFLMIWVYFTSFEASVWQATPGKRILGLYVTDLSGRPLTFARAAIRNVARLISGVMLIGYILAGFTEKKQTLHDILAGCLVLRRP